MLYSNLVPLTGKKGMQGSLTACTALGRLDRRKSCSTSLTVLVLGYLETGY